jgi:VanZ family protein
MSAWTHTFRLAGWFCVVVLAYLSLVPHDMEVRTTLPPGVEHLISYAATAVVLTLGYPGRKVLRIAAALILYSSALELLQFFSPGRHPGLDGVVWSGLGALAGTALVSAALRWGA